MQQVLKSNVLGAKNFGNNISKQDIKKISYSGIPNEYIYFIKEYGVGQLSDTFLLDFEILEYDEIFNEEDNHLEGMYFFGGDLGEYLFAFDSKNNWQIVEIDSSGEVFDVVAQTFTEFIHKKFDELIEIEKYRKNNP